MDGKGVVVDGGAGGWDRREMLVCLGEGRGRSRGGAGGEAGDPRGAGGWLVDGAARLPVWRVSHSALVRLLKTQRMRPSLHEQVTVHGKKKKQKETSQWWCSAH